MTTIQLINQLESTVTDIEYHYDSKGRCIVDRINLACYPAAYEYQQAAKNHLRLEYAIYVGDMDNDAQGEVYDTVK